MRFDKIIYIRYIPLTVKIYEDYYMSEALDSGFEVEYWDISKLFFVSNYGQEDSSHLLPTKKFKNYHELEQALRILKKRTLIISIMTFDGRVRHLYHLFTKYKCVLGIFGRNMFPLSPNKSCSIFHKISNLNFSMIKNFFQTRMLMIDQKFTRIKDHDIVFVGGNCGLRGAGHITSKNLQNAEVIKINSNDYDRYLQLRKNSNRLIEGKYILFLDEYLPLHPDTKLLSLDAIKPEEYYPLLNAYFDRVEKQFGMPVVIAAHPKALRYKEENFFGGRSVYFDSSAILCRGADFVIAHASTSVNYPVVFGKKLHFITSKSIERKMKSIHQNVICFAKYLGCNVQYFDQPHESVNLIEVLDEERYRAYKYDFQTSFETEEKLTKDIFVKFICE